MLKHQIKSFWFLTFNLHIQSPLQQKTNYLIILSTTLLLPVAPLTLVTKNQLLGFHPSLQLWLPCFSLERNKLDKSAMTLKEWRCIFTRIFTGHGCFQLSHFFDLSNEHNIQMCLWIIKLLKCQKPLIVSDLDTIFQHIPRLPLTVTAYLTATMCHNTWKKQLMTC